MEEQYYARSYIYEPTMTARTNTISLVESTAKLLLIETWRLIPIAPFERTNNLVVWWRKI